MSKDYAFPIQGFGRVPAPSDRAFSARLRPRGLGLTPPNWSAKPISCPAGYSWVNAYPPSPSSPKVPELTGALVKWIRNWASLYPSRAAADGNFYFKLSSGLPIMFSPGFGSVSVCASKSSVAAHQSGGSAPIVVAGAPMTFNPALVTLTSQGAMPVTAAPTSYTWLWVLLGLGAAGAAGYYLID
jgi:hypothetical protein